MINLFVPNMCAVRCYWTRSLRTRKSRPGVLCSGAVGFAVFLSTQILGLWKAYISTWTLNRSVEFPEYVSWDSKVQALSPQGHHRRDGIQGSMCIAFRVKDAPGFNIQFVSRVYRVIWVVVKIMVPFWIPIIIRHLIFRVPKKGP